MPTSEKVLSVEQLNRRARKLLEGEFPSVTVEGEISNFSRPASGHWYFTLKDSKAQIRAAMFKGYNARLKFTPANGDRLEVRGKVSLYEGRGDFQLIAEHLAPAGLGLLQQRFDELKAKLAELGYFNEEHKKPLPSQAKRIAIITSPTGAAVRDMIAVLERRNRFLAVDIFPSLVQGEGAAATITAQLKKADELHYDLIVLTRGGGSLEDLWSFNDEHLAEAIYQARTPVISAVGHEIDFSISDFVADVRAPTPSAAAELLSRDMSELPAALNQARHRMHQGINRLLSHLRKDVKLASLSLSNPKERIQQLNQSFDFVEGQLQGEVQRKIAACSSDFQNLRLRLTHQDPRRTIQQQKASIEQRLQRLANAYTAGVINPKLRRLEILSQRLRAYRPEREINAYKTTIERSKARLLSASSRQLKELALRLERLKQSLHLVNPTSIMERGYAIVFDEQGNAIRSASNLVEQQTLKAQFYEGEAITRVIRINDSDTDASAS